MYDRKKKITCMVLALLISFLVTGSVVYAQKEKLQQQRIQEGIAEEVFRFHVLANSDSAEDQRLKLRVKEAVISYLNGEITESESAEETKEWVRMHLTEIEKVAQGVIRRSGKQYEVEAEVTHCLFPQKSYGDVTLPAGYYDALRVKIGEGKGQNWWCVLYPSLCFMDSVRAVVPDEGKEQLKQILTEEEYEEVTEVKIKWFCLQMCEGVCRITDVANWR